MLWSYWRIKPDGLRSPLRPTAYTNRVDAAQALSPRQRFRTDLRLVSLMLRVDGDRVVPEFGIEAPGKGWSLKCRRSGSQVVIRGEVPEALWYESDERKGG